ncbi:hypothetical protein [Tessaracoccus oleiagri]|uniref:HTH luxR-type domain-containing protein n=1 Tax=Tessaracoccus oleiagri TaxID=686624 RepID=A0A1G9L3H8_9ACTN|nr:hypothetical protein [Tessaracoccus oleiagri]SDL56356.1 hypothetical protein SAMN04488242_1982 [Tessaracoccus oleiagri]
MTDPVLDARILVHVIATGRSTLGGLSRCLDQDPKTLVRRIRSLVAAGALELSSTGDDTQLALAAGRPEPIAAHAADDDSGTIGAWLQLCRARAGHGTIGLRSRAEFDTVAARYNHRARGVVFLLSRAVGEQGRAWRDLNLGLIRELLGLGKRVRMLISHSFLDSPTGRAFATSVIDSGGQLHATSRVDTPMILWERLGAVHFLPHRGQMLLQTEGVDALQPLTDTWVGSASPAQQVTSATVIRLLAAGHTDAGAARKLGISERQFRRHVSVLMQELDASSRFQAGIEAARSMQW